MSEPQIVRGSDERYRVWDGQKMVAVYEPGEAAKAQDHLDRITAKRPARVAAPAPVPQVIELSAPPPVNRRSRTHAATDDPETPHIKRFSDGWRVWNPSPKVRAYVGDGTRGAFQTLQSASGRMRQIIMELAEDGVATKKVAKKAAQLSSQGPDLFGAPAPAPRVVGVQSSMFTEGTMIPEDRPARAGRAAAAPAGQGAFKFNGGRYYVTRGDGRGDTFMVMDPEGYPAGGGMTREAAQEMADHENAILDARRARSRSESRYSSYAMNGHGKPSPSMMALLTRIRRFELGHGGRGMDVSSVPGRSVSALRERGLITVTAAGTFHSEVWRGRPGSRYVQHVRGTNYVANVTRAGVSLLGGD